jgi:uncharacterized protein YgiM (DUF1202 family)
MRRQLTSVALFCGVALLAGVLTVSGLSFTADTVAKVASIAPVKTSNLKPSYVAYLPTAKADDLNIAKAVPVTIKAPTSPGPVASSPASSFSHTVTVESLRVRAGPVKTSRQVFALGGGAKVTVGRTERGWVMITAEDGRAGWVYGKFLRPQGQVADVQ